jgi:2-keto-3-deoxy-L-rhamnonate aldolase RhmA
MLPQVDILSLHLPLTPESRDLIDAAALALMKPSAVVVNTSRGGIVNEAALYRAISSGRLFGAGFDVFETEPPTADSLDGVADFCGHAARQRRYGGNPDPQLDADGRAIVRGAGRRPAARPGGVSSLMPDTDKLINPAKARMQAGGVALGMPVRLGRSGDIARIAKSTGHDFLFIDCQHSLFNLETIGHIAGTAMACGVAPLVRVRGIDDPDVSLLLDNGAMGIVYPDVNTAAEARRAVDTCKFAPIGRRSVSGGYPHFDYRAVPLTESVPQLNDVCLLVCMIETVEGLNNVEAIAAVKGVDVLHIGSNDLLANMGKPGQFDDPALVEAQERVIAACRDNRIFAGCGGNRDVARQVDLIKKGCQFITTQSDIGFLQAAASKWTAGIRDGLA